MDTVDVFLVENVAVTHNSLAMIAQQGDYDDDDDDDDDDDN